MPRCARQASESNIYHVTARGVGRHRIFEDDEDRQRMVGAISRFACKHDIKIIAWALMENHTHILAEAPIAHISSFMGSLLTSYSQTFNGRHGHVGHVFQGRYHSEPVEGDAHLLAIIRYIHLNPLASGVANPEEYPWSSYQQYLGRDGICDVSRILRLFDSLDDLRSFHDSKEGQEIIRLDGYHPRIDDAEASRIAESAFGPFFEERIVSMDKEERDKALQRLYLMGLSGAQIVRLLGLGRNIVQRACSKVRR